MDKHEHKLRQGLRSAVEEAMTASLSVGEAVEVALLAAEIYAASQRLPQTAPFMIHVVTWPAPGQAPMRQALGYRDAGDAKGKRDGTDGAEIWMLEVV